MYSLSRFVRLAPAVAMLLLLPTPAVRAQDASWLDAAVPASWNEPGSGIPAAPALQGSVDSRCEVSARAPELDEDRRVQERGWILVDPYEAGHDTVVIRGAADYDGMCRPLQYQAFVFRRGTFVGTLSPAPMNSRSDGDLGEVSVEEDNRLTADYLRYAEEDSACCPSRVTRVVFEVDETQDLMRPVSVSTSLLR